MSYDIYLKDASTGETLMFDAPLDLRGGTFCMGGTKEAWLNVTWNYRPFFCEHIDPLNGIRALYGKTGRNAIPILKGAIGILGTDRDADYWKATPGNAGAALADLLVLAEAFPDGIFDGD